MDPYSSTSITPKKMVQSLYLNRRLICQMAKREVIGRYRGSVMGLAWSFFNPLIMLVVYTFVFSVVFKARWGTGSDSKTEFALALFIGMIVHGLLAECVTKAPGLIVGNASYVKKVIFPLEILPWIAMASTLFHTMVSLLVWGLFFCHRESDISLDRSIFTFVILATHIFNHGINLVSGIVWSVFARCRPNYRGFCHGPHVHVTSFLSNFKYTGKVPSYSLCQSAYFHHRAGESCFDVGTGYALGRFCDFTRK